jgi:hypothetical protein
MMALGLLSLVVLSSCFDGDDPVAIQVAEPPQAATKTEALDLFKVAYGSMNLDNYMALLHPDFEFVYKNSWDGTMGSFDYGDELQISTNMFSGEPRTNAGGELQGGISSIDVKKMDVMEWSAVPVDDPLYGTFPSAESAGCLVEIVFTYDDPNTGNPSTYTVDGVQAFVVAPEILDDESVAWKLVRHLDKASGAKNGDSTWASIKMLFL